jgi:hypothetical protein
VAMTKTKIPKISEVYSPIIPIHIPELEKVRNFANHLHSLGNEWQGEFEGWQAEYHPEQSEPPLDSKMTFTPADFCIGESGIWFFSMMWEKGKNHPPQEFLDDTNILKDD